MALKTTAGTMCEFPYTVWLDISYGLDNSSRQQRRDWIQENIGHINVMWSWTHTGDGMLYEFKTQEDAVRFTLTWL